MLSGSITILDRDYVIGLNAARCNGDSLLKEQVRAPGKDRVLKAIDEAAIGLRRKLGESLRSLQEFATPVEEASTPSLEALKAYSLGWKTWKAKGDAASLPFFQSAVELDPKFAMAFSKMGAVYGNLGETSLGRESMRKAYELRHKVSEREQLYIDSHYYNSVTGELEKAGQVYEIWRQTYPRDLMSWSGLGIIYSTLGKHEKALEVFQDMLAREPTSGAEWLWGNDLSLVAAAYYRLDRLNAAESVFKEAELHKLKNEYLLVRHYHLAFLMGDAAQMARLVAAAMHNPPAEGLLLASQSDTEAWYGRLRKARQLTHQAVDSAVHDASAGTAAEYRAEAALREAELVTSQTLEQMPVRR